MAGIEDLWGEAKRVYKEVVDQHRAHNRNWSQLGLVEDILTSISDDNVRKYATNGMAKLMKARPILPLPHEEQPEGYPSPLIYKIQRMMLGSPEHEDEEEPQEVQSSSEMESQDGFEANLRELDPGQNLFNEAEEK